MSLSRVRSAASVWGCSIFARFSGVFGVLVLIVPVSMVSAQGPGATAQEASRATDAAKRQQERAMNESGNYGSGGPSSPGGASSSGGPGSSGGPSGSGNGGSGNSGSGYGGPSGSGSGGSGYGSSGYDPSGGSPGYGGSGSGYGGSGYGGSGSGYGGAGGMSSTSGMMQIYAPGLVSLFKEIDLMPLLKPQTDLVIETGPVLKREAEQAFTAGYQGLAIQLMCGHMVTEYEDAKSELAMAKFSLAQRRPAWCVRWAVSMAVRGSEDAVDPQPIREGTTSPRRGVASSGGPPSGYGGSSSGRSRGGSSSGPPSGYSGPSEEEQRQMAQQSSYGGGYGGSGPSGSGMGGPSGPGMGYGAPAKPKATIVREMLSEKADEELDENLGLVAEVIAEEFAQRFGSGDFGPLFSGITAPEKPDPNAGFNPAKPVVAASAISEMLEQTLSESPDPVPMWRPGLRYLGLGASSDMLLMAKLQDIDFLLHFDVLLKPGRDDSVQNVSRCRLFNISDGKQLGLSKSFDSVEAAQMISTGRAANERAYVKDQMSNLLGIIDRDTKVITMPTTLTAAAAKRRIASLIGGPNAQTLQTLAEVRLYQSMNLLTPEEVETVFDIVGGSEGLLLLHGPREERLQMARTWAMKSQPGANK